MQSKQMRNSQSIALVVLLLVLLVFAVIHGPNIVEHASFPVLDVATLPDGSELSLLCATKRKWLRVESKALLLVCHEPAGDAFDRPLGANVMHRQDRDYQIRTDPIELRAWVVGLQTGEVVFSVDYSAGTWWSTDEQQPE